MPQADVNYSQIVFFRILKDIAYVNIARDAIVPISLEGNQEVAVKKLRKIFMSLATPLLGIVAALLFLIEDVLWSRLAVLMARLSKLPAVAWLERWIGRQPPLVALLLFLIPTLLLLPVKLGALWCLAHGKQALGLAVLGGGKVIGTALGTRIFVLTKPSLMTVAWFAAVHDWVLGTKARLFAYVGGFWAVKRARATLSYLRVEFFPRRKGVLTRRISALRQMLRRAFA